MTSWLALVPAAGLLLAPAICRAEGQSSDWDGGYGAKAKRRSDFTLAAGGGLSLGSAHGYPNEIDKLDDPNFRSSTKLGLGSGGAVWLGVAFNDYLTFGIGAGGLSLKGGDREASGGGFLFHIDAYPLFAVSPPLEDLSLFTNLGAGGLQIKGGDETADGGLMSYVEGGVAFEHFRFWQIACGPSVSYIHMWSQSATLHAALIGGRFAFYGGP